MPFLKRDKYGGEHNLFKILPIAIEGLRVKTQKKTPLLHRVIFGEPRECYVYKIIIGAALGLIVSIVFYEWILIGMAFERSTIYTLGIVFTAILTAGCALSTQIRCITFLTVPSFSGKAGRHIVQALIISKIMSGPVPNIMSNIEEIMRMYTCSNSMAHNLSEARYDLLVKPFKMAFLNSKIESEEFKDMLGSVNNVVEPFAQELEGVDDVKFIQEENDYMDEKLNDTKRSDELEKKYSLSKLKKLISTNKSEEFDKNNNATSNDTEAAEAYQQTYFKKLETRCENVKTAMGKACKKRFSDFKTRCEDAIHWAISWAVCWPMRLDVICDIVKMFTYGGYDCDPSSEVSPSIGKGYVDLKKAPETLQSKVLEERTQYKLVKPPNFVGLHSVITIAKEFSHEIYIKKSFADAALTIIKTLLAFMFILVICSASNYHNNFLRFTDFDNKYVTSDFRVLDARRRQFKRPTLLPQTKTERNRSIDPYSPMLSQAERSSWGQEFWMINALVLLCSAIVGIDFALAQALDWMHDNLEFSYTEHGHHTFKIDVEGTGFVASLVRSIIKSFDFKKVLNGEVSNKACLPIAKHLGFKDYLKLYGTCGILSLLTYCEGYLKRFRRAICAFYYREQEKRRIETFYRKTLSYRQRMFQRTIEEMYKKAKKNEEVYAERLLFRIQTNFPWLSCLRICPSARPVCVLCEEEEAFFLWWKPKYQRCSECHSHYCTECWTNFNYTCFTCTGYTAITEKTKPVAGDVLSA